VENRITHRSSEPQMFQGAQAVCVVMRQDAESCCGSVCLGSPEDKVMTIAGTESGFFAQRPGLLDSCMTLHLRSGPGHCV
jgi:hypothetical protein